MRLHTHQTALAPALQTALRAVPARTTLPALSGVLLTTESDHLTLQATDLDLAICTRVPADVSTPGAVLLPARFLAEIVRRLPPVTVTVDVDPVNWTATIAAGSSEFVVHGQAPENFPGLPRPEGGQMAAPSAALLRRVLQTTLFAASEDDARPILTGVQITFRTGELRALSTDGFRIAYRRVPDDSLADDADLSVTLPRRTLAEVARLLGDEGTVSLLAARTHVLFHLGHVQVLSRVLEGAYPPVLDLVPKTYPARLRVERERLEAACERVSLLADPLQRAYPVTLSWATGSLVLSASSPSVGRAREELPAHAEGDAFHVIFNAQLLLDGLRNVQASDVVLELSGPLTAARLSSPQDDGYLYVLMPMRPPEA